MPARSVRLSPSAVTDLEGIRQYTVEQWGHGQWRRYSDELDRRFQQLAENPAIAPARDEIRPGLHSAPTGSHVIWYRVGVDALEVVRILHAAMDPEAQF